MSKGERKEILVAINDKAGDWWIWLSMIVIDDNINDKDEVCWHDMKPKQASVWMAKDDKGGWHGMNEPNDPFCGYLWFIWLLVAWWGLETLGDGHCAYVLNGGLNDLWTINTMLVLECVGSLYHNWMICGHWSSKGCLKKSLHLKHWRHSSI